MYVMPHIATAQYLNHSAMPHARQMPDDRHPVRDAVDTWQRRMITLLHRYGR